MKLELKRIALKENYTIGKLYIDDVFFSDTLEDKVRDFGEKGLGKVHGQTAIPCGTYNIKWNISGRFKVLMPYLQNVPYFSYVMIHGGNKPEHTEGCILVGKNTIKGQLTESQATLKKLFDIIQKESYVTITITN